jgi:hypothetical protein
VRSSQIFRCFPWPHTPRRTGDKQGQAVTESADVTGDKPRVTGDKRPFSPRKSQFQRHCRRSRRTLEIDPESRYEPPLNGCPQSGSAASLTDAQDVIEPDKLANMQIAGSPPIGAIALPADKKRREPIQSC